MPFKQSEMYKWQETAIVGVFTLLLSGNIFFVKRLVDEIDATKQMVVALHEQVQVIQTQLSDRILDTNYLTKKEKIKC